MLLRERIVRENGGRLVVALSLVDGKFPTWKYYLIEGGKISNKSKEQPLDSIHTPDVRGFALFEYHDAKGIRVSSFIAYERYQKKILELLTVASAHPRLTQDEVSSLNGLLEKFVSDCSSAEPEPRKPAQKKKKKKEKPKSNDKKKTWCSPGYVPGGAVVDEGPWTRQDIEQWENLIHGDTVLDEVILYLVETCKVRGSFHEPLTDMTQERISADLGLTATSVRKAMRHLMSEGLLQWTWAGPGGRHANYLRKVRGVFDRGEFDPTNTEQVRWRLLRWLTNKLGGTFSIQEALEEVGNADPQEIAQLIEAELDSSKSTKRQINGVVLGHLRWISSGGSTDPEGTHRVLFDVSTKTFTVREAHKEAKKK